MNKNWTKEGYKLYAMKDGFIMDFTMGSSESIENEIIAKGTRNYDFWLVEKDGKIDFYSVKIDPMAQGLGIEITKEKTISGTIVEDKRSNYQGFGAIGGGVVVDFMNYKIIEKTPGTMNIVKENESVFDVKDEVLLEKIKENLANWDGSCYYDDEKTYRADIVIGYQIYSIEVSADIKSDGSDIVFGNSILVKRTR